MSDARIAPLLRVIAEQVVEKGNVRNTVLRQINALEKAHKLLSQGKDIKDKEISEYLDKNPEKAKVLKEQVSVISSGMKHIEQSVEELKKYKDLTTSDL